MRCGSSAGPVRALVVVVLGTAAVFGGWLSFAHSCRAEAEVRPSLGRGQGPPLARGPASTTTTSTPGCRVADADGADLPKLTSTTGGWRKGQNETWAMACKPYPGKRVILVQCNTQYLDMFRNWLWHASQFLNPHTDQLVVAAESNYSATVFRDLSGLFGVHWDVQFICTAGESTEKSLYDAPLFGAVVVHRPTQILKVLQQGCSVLYSDVDLVWVRSIFPAIDATGKSDAYYANDKNTGKILPANTGHGNLCPCTMYLHPTRANYNLMANWARNMSADPKLHKFQFAFNFVIKQQMRDAGKIDYQILSQEAFPSGWMLSKFKDTIKAKAVVLHANWMVGTVKKSSVLEGLGSWNPKGLPWGHRLAQAESALQSAMAGVSGVDIEELEATLSIATALGVEQTILDRAQIVSAGFGRLYSAGEWRKDQNETWAKACKPYPGKRVILVQCCSKFTHLDMFRNWLWHASQFLNPHTDQLVVAAESSYSATVLRGLAGLFGVHWDVQFIGTEGESTEQSLYDAPLFFGAGVHRPMQILKVLQQGCSVLYSDVDLAWVRSIFPAIDATGKSDAYFANDINTGKILPANQGHGNLCTCTMYFHPTRANYNLMANWARNMSADPKLHKNQFAFNFVIKQMRDAGKIDYQILSQESFPSGWMLSRFKDTIKAKAVVLHADWMVGTTQKSSVLEGLGLWNPKGLPSGQSLGRAGAG